MSKPEIDSDGFTKVKSKKRISTKTNIPQNQIQYDLEKNVVINVDKAIQRTRSCVEDLKLSNYHEDIIKSVSNILQGRKVVEIICFGLGHVAESNISRYQLGLLLCLKEHCIPEKVLVHDPIFYKGECELLSKLGLQLIPENSEGSYVISDQGPTIVYLPHCSRQLTNNFLWSNWNLNLHNCVLICNSFNQLLERLPVRLLTETVPYICKIKQFTDELSLKNNFKYTDIFNDTSIHTFPKHFLEEAGTVFWMKGDKPVYTNTEEFISSSIVQKLNI